MIGYSLMPHDLSFDMLSRLDHITNSIYNQSATLLFVLQVKALTEDTLLFLEKLCTKLVSTDHIEKQILVGIHRHLTSGGANRNANTSGVTTSGTATATLLKIQSVIEFMNRTAQGNLRPLLTATHATLRYGHEVIPCKRWGN